METSEAVVVSEAVMAEEDLKGRSNPCVVSPSAAESQFQHTEVRSCAVPGVGRAGAAVNGCFSCSPSAESLPSPRLRSTRRLVSSGPWCTVSPVSSRRTRLYPQPPRARKAHPQRSSGLRSKAQPRSSRARFPQPRSSRARFPQPKSFHARFAQPCSQGEQKWRVTREPTLGPAPSSVLTVHSLQPSGQRFG